MRYIQRKEDELWEQELWRIRRLKRRERELVWEVVKQTETKIVFQT